MDIETNLMPDHYKRNLSSLNDKKNREETRKRAKTQAEKNIEETKARNKAARIAANRAKTLEKQRQLDAAAVIREEQKKKKDE